MKDAKYRIHDMHQSNYTVHFYKNLGQGSSLEEFGSENVYQMQSEMAA